ncbi:hypothetical protein ACFQU2_36940 [Siccirubricoccus deserti]
MPLGGLGLPLAEAGRNGIPDEAYAAALGQVMIPPAVDLGVDQSKPLSGGETCDPGYLLGWFRHGMLSDAPSPDHPALSGLTSVWQIAPVLAFIDLPATDTLQTCAAGFRKVLHRLAQGDVALDALPNWERWPHRLRRPLAWTFPRGAARHAGGRHALRCGLPLVREVAERCAGAPLSQTGRGRGGERQCGGHVRAGDSGRHARR